MKSGNGRRGGAFASVALVLCGSVMLLANGPYRVPVRAAAGPAPSAQETACYRFWNIDRDTGPNGHGVGHESSGDISMYRNKHYADGTLNMFNGAVIGGLENTSTTANSDAYPQIGPGAKGCIFFKRRQGTASAADASIYFFSTAQTFPLAHALYCQHHPAGAPIWAKVPTDCPRLALTVGRYVVTVTPPRGQKSFATADDVLAALHTQLLKRFGKVQAEAIIKTVGVNGAWYPCDANGCCRAV